MSFIDIQLTNDIRITEKELTGSIVGFVTGACATYATDQILNNIIPTSSGPAMIATTIGKYAISGLVGDMVYVNMNDFTNTIFDAMEETHKVMEGIVEELDS